MSRFTHVFKHSKLVFFLFFVCIFLRIFLICKLKVNFLNITAIASPSIYLIYPIYSTKFYTFSCSARCFLYSSKFFSRSFICSIPIIWFPLEKMKFYIAHLLCRFYKLLDDFTTILDTEALCKCISLVSSYRIVHNVFPLFYIFIFSFYFF